MYVSDDAALKQSEKTARESKKGLWADPWPVAAMEVADPPMSSAIRSIRWIDASCLPLLSYLTRVFPRVRVPKVAYHKKHALEDAM